MPSSGVVHVQNDNKTSWVASPKSRVSRIAKAAHFGARPSQRKLSSPRPESDFFDRQSRPSHQSSGLVVAPLLCVPYSYHGRQTLRFPARIGTVTTKLKLLPTV